MANNEFYTINLKTFSEFPEVIVSNASIRIDDLYVSDRNSVQYTNDKILQSMIGFLNQLHRELFIRKLPEHIRSGYSEMQINSLEQISQFLFFLFHEKYTACSRKLVMEVRRKLSSLLKKINSGGVKLSGRGDLYRIEDTLQMITEKVQEGR